MSQPIELPRWMDVAVLPAVNLAIALAVAGGVQGVAGAAGQFAQYQMYQPFLEKLAGGGGSGGRSSAPEMDFDPSTFR